MRIIHEGDDDCIVIFRRFRKDPRSGRLLDARKYGLKAWPIRIPRNQLELPL